MSRNLLIAVIAIVLARAGFAGGWISGRATDHNKSCGVLPAWTDVSAITTIVYPPELDCK
jgi:hypothetical protein